MVLHIHALKRCAAKGYIEIAIILKVFGHIGLGKQRGPRSN